MSTTQIPESPSRTARALTPGQVIRRLLLGRPIATEEAGHQLLRKLLALPIFSSDALSSVAYATEEIMLVLILAGASALSLAVPLSLGIGALLIIVVASYRQTIHAYPSGGGAYIVSHENLGEMPGLVAAGALLVDYVLTVSVSIAAGVAAIISAAPSLAPQRVPMALVLILLVTVMNLRGVKESGTFFAFPTYAFIILIFSMLLTGFVRCLGGCPEAATSHAAITAEHGLTLFMVLKAFSSGSTALTGVEAISNGVPMFQRPKTKNAATTLVLMGTISVSMFLGISFLATALKVRPITEHLIAEGFHEKTVVAQIAETVFGHGLMFFLLQAITALILILAANTAYQGFPTLASILARDRYMPRQFRNRGDRLVFSNGIIVLAILASLLIVLFSGEVTRLIQLYVVGVFTSFTLSQFGMVRHWFKHKAKNWKRSALVNGVGGLVTFVVAIVVTATKFTHGAYIVVIAIPIIVLGFKRINNHYKSVAMQLRVQAETPKPATGTSVVILVHHLNHAALRAIGYALSLRPSSLRALFVGEEADALRVEWERRQIRVPLEVTPLVKNDLTASVRAYIRNLPLADDEFRTIVIPERIQGRGVGQMVRDRRILLLKAGLLFERRTVVTDVPDPVAETTQDRPETPHRNIGVVLVSAVHNATLQAVAYGQAIHPTDLKAVTFAVDSDETAQIMSEWVDAGPQVPLEILDSPYREVARPLARFVRQIRAKQPDATVTIILPEFVVKKWWHHFMHNQTALRIKAAMLFEPGVVVTSVPFHLR